MMLCLAHSLIADRQLNPADLLHRFWDWATNNEHCSQARAFGFGQNTLRSLSRYHRTGQTIASSNGRSSDGNGTIMRLAPIPIVHNQHLNEARRLSRIQSYATHASDKAADCAEALGCLLVHLFNGETFESACNTLVDYSENWTPEVAALALGDWKDKHRDDISSQGYVVHTLEASLWSVYTTDSFQAALIKAVNLGHDADTVGAVTGQIAGALYGLEAIPARWKNVLLRPEHLQDTVDLLLTVSDSPAT